jgi:hypothetical protein
VGAGGVPPDEVVRVAASVGAVAAPPAAEPRVVGRSHDASEVAYRVEYADRPAGEGDGPCVTLVVEDDEVASRCGLDPDDGPIVEFGAVVVERGVVLWGVFGPPMGTVEMEFADGRQALAEALPLDRGDPRSMRYLVFLTPRIAAGELSARFLDADGSLVDTDTFDFVGRPPTIDLTQLVLGMVVTSYGRQPSSVGCGSGGGRGRAR